MSKDQCGKWVYRNDPWHCCARGPNSFNGTWMCVYKAKHDALPEKWRELRTYPEHRLSKKNHPNSVDQEYQGPPPPVYLTPAPAPAAAEPPMAPDFDSDVAAPQCEPTRAQWVGMFRHFQALRPPEYSSVADQGFDMTGQYAGAGCQPPARAVYQEQQPRAQQEDRDVQMIPHQQPDLFPPQGIVRYQDPRVIYHDFTGKGGMYRDDPVPRPSELQPLPPPYEPTGWYCRRCNYFLGAQCVCMRLCSNCGQPTQGNTIFK
jgi:hypothetical protein